MVNDSAFALLSGYKRRSKALCEQKVTHVSG